MIWVDQLGAAMNDTPAVVEPRLNQRMGGIERLRSYRAGLEKLWAVVAPDDRLAVTSTHHGIPIDHNARRDLTLLCRYCHRLANADRKRRSYDRELQNGRLLLKGAAPPLQT